MGFPDSSISKESACNAGDPDLIPGLGRSPGRGHVNPLQYSCLENPHGQRSLEGHSPWRFTRQEHWSGLPCPLPGDLPNPGIKPEFLSLQADSLPTELWGKIPGLGRCPGEGKGYPFQYSDQENSMDCIVRGVTKSQTWLSNSHFTKPSYAVITIIHFYYIFYHPSQSPCVHCG